MTRTAGRSASPFGRRGLWVAGGLATLLVLLWTAGDAVAVRRPLSDPRAMRMLRDSADAARRTPYSGVRFVTSWNPQGSTTSQVTVAHTPGEGTMVRSTEARGARGRVPSAAFQPDGSDSSGGLTGFTPAMLGLLTRNYSVVPAADETICGRAAHVVEARRSDGTAAGRFWIDRQTGLMLHRELLDAAERTVSATGFREVRVAPPLNPQLAGSGSRQDAAVVAPRPGAGVQEPWGERLGDDDLRTLRDDGWSAPQKLPGGLRLQEARRPSDPDDDGVVHLSYTDGLAVISVFVQRGSIDERRFTRWRRTLVRGRTVFRYEALERWSVWSSDGFVYSVLADSSRSDADTVVNALPHGNGGFWGRMDRGFARLRSWMNPFG